MSQDQTYYPKRIKVLFYLWRFGSYLHKTLIFKAPIGIAHEQVIPFTIAGILFFMRPVDELSNQINYTTDQNSMIIAILCISMVWFVLPFFSLFIIFNPKRLEFIGFKNAFGSLYNDLKRTKTGLSFNL